MKTEEKLNAIIEIGKKKDANDLQIQALEKVFNNPHTRVTFLSNDHTAEFVGIDEIEPGSIALIKDFTMEVLKNVKHKLINEAAELIKS